MLRFISDQEDSSLQSLPSLSESCGAAVQAEVSSAELVQPRQICIALRSARYERASPGCEPAVVSGFAGAASVHRHLPLAASAKVSLLPQEK